MSLRLGDIAPNFKAKTTAGEIDFYEYLGNNWGVLFSHPADFTPVCTTELGKTAMLTEEFKKRNVNVLAVSVDPLDKHLGWVNDINETQNCSVATPADWKSGEDVIVVPAVSTEDAVKKFPKGVKVVKPYLRYTPQPNVE